MKRIWLVLGCAVALSGLVSAEGRVKVDVNGNVLVAQAAEDVAGAQVTVTGPGGFVLERAFAAGEAVALSLADRDGAGLRDGEYSFEVVCSPRATPVRGAAEAAGSEAAAQGPRASGTFRVAGGQAALPVAAAESTRGPGRVATSDAPVPPMPDDQVIPDDLIVQGSICTGFDCVNNENFGFDTIRLKENNLRIKFEDTSTGTFPTNDWELTANDSASGGANRFSITDVNGGKTPFTVTAGAPTSSIHVDSSGRVGLRTATPVLDLHVKTGNTPAMRLEQDGSSGFTAQTWDVAGNEANFFIRDVTGGSRLPFRVRPGAPTSSIDISADGDVGFGTASPSASLHVRHTDGTAKLLVEEASATAGDRVLMTLQNTAANNKSRFLIQSGTGADGIWTFDNNGQSLNTFAIVKVGSGTTAFTLNANGNLTIAGTLTQNSDRDTKDGIQEVDAREVLAKVSELPISTWHYKTDDAEVTHLGPMAQDFAAAFGLGQDERHIAPVDMGGVALAAIKALHQEVAAKDSRIQALETQVAQLKKLEERLAQLEAARNR